MDMAIAWSVLTVTFGCLAVLAWVGDKFETRRPAKGQEARVRR